MYKALMYELSIEVVAHAVYTCQNKSVRKIRV